LLDLQDIRRRYDLRAMIPAGIDYRDTERCRVQRCLWHRELDPSLLVFQDGYFCKACRERGDVIDWIQFEKRLTFKEALDYLCRNAGTTVYETPAFTEPRPLPCGVALDYHLELTREALAYYEHRGLSKETIVRFQLGYGKPPGHDFNRFTIPIYRGDDLVNVKFRRDDTCPYCGSFDTKEQHGTVACPCGASWAAVGTKYFSLKNRGTPRLFNDRILSGGVIAQCQYGIIPRVVITEGEFDAMVTTQHGYPAVASTGGALNFQRGWAPAFAPVRQVYSIFDNDTAGNKGRSILHLSLPRVVDVFLPVKEDKADLTDYFRLYDSSDFEAMINSAKRHARNQRQVAWLRRDHGQSYN